MDDLAIQLEDVDKSYRRGSSVTRVLQGVNFEVPRGECVFLTGPSGSGKTTLLSILGCILSPDMGRVNILGRETTGLVSCERSALRRDQIGFVFQRFHLIRGLTALDNTCVPLVLRGITALRAREQALRLLEAVGLGDQTNARPQNLSAGQCQRIAIARALAANPDLVLADEPTASLDAENGQQVMSLLLGLTAARGKTLIVVTHDSRIYGFADRLCRMEQGQVLEHRHLSETVSADESQR